MNTEGSSMFAIRIQHGFCHAAAGAAIHLRATPVLKASSRRGRISLKRK
jgi:hypothetical protein